MTKFLLVIEVVAMTPTAQLTRLSALDRCDRCGAQAQVQVDLAVGAELLFCTHHAREYYPKLRDVAILIRDELSVLSP